MLHHQKQIPHNHSIFRHVHKPNVPPHKRKLLMVVVQFQGTERKDEECEDKSYHSLEMVQVVQLSLDHLQAAEERIS